MIIFSSADMEASRGAIHKGMRETPQVQQKSPYAKSATRQAAARAGAHLLETVRKNPISVLAIGTLFGFALGAFSDVRSLSRRPKRTKRQ